MILMPGRLPVGVKLVIHPFFSPKPEFLEMDSGTIRISPTIDLSRDCTASVQTDLNRAIYREVTISGGIPVLTITTAVCIDLFT